MNIEENIKKYKNDLNNLEKQENNLTNLLEKYTKKNCSKCSYYNADRVDYFIDRFKECRNCNHKNEMRDIAVKLDEIIDAIDLLIEHDYARSLYEYYSVKKPILIRNRTGEEFTWEEAFGNDFEQVSISLRHSLVGLPDGQGRYKLKV